MSQMMSMGRIGIITGAGPDAGIDLWQKILKHNKALYQQSDLYHYMGDLSAPEVVVHSLPQLGFAMDIKQHEALLWEQLKTALARMCLQVDFVCIACNVLHYFVDKIKQLKLDVEFVSIVDVVEQYLKKNTNVALLSISNVIEFGQYSPYSKSAEKYPIETPASAAMDKLVHSIKNQGAEHPDTVAQFSSILATLKADKLVLACTDLPLLPLKLFEKDFIDASDMLAQTIAQKVFYFEPMSLRKA